MAAFFFDSSSLVKRYAREIGTSWVFGLVRSFAGHRLYLALIAGAEVTAGLTKKHRESSLSQTAMRKAIVRFEREFSNKFLLIGITPALINRAVQLIKKHPLRGYDAVQLAAALTANDERLSLRHHRFDARFRQ